MRILSVKLALPSRRISNQDLLALIQQHSQDSFSGDLNATLDQVCYFLERSGAKTRYWLGENESPLDLIESAVGEALTEAGLQSGEIDLMIHAGVDRGFLEPANAYFVAQSLGLDRIHCFDVLDACNGWSRALLLVHSLMETGVYRTAMIINSEFNMFAGGAVYPRLFGLRRPEQLEYSFGGFTLGEGAAVTILDNRGEHDWEFRFKSRPDLADLCSVPETGYERYTRPTGRTARNGERAFYSFSRELFSHAMQALMQFAAELETDLQEVKIVFPHAASKNAWRQGAEMLGINHLFYHIYPTCGNLGSASIPAGMALAADEGLLGRGDRFLAAVGSAGMSFSAISGVY